MVVAILVVAMVIVAVMVTVIVTICHRHCHRQVILISVVIHRHRDSRHRLLLVIIAIVLRMIFSSCFSFDMMFENKLISPGDQSLQHVRIEAGSTIFVCLLDNPLAFSVQIHARRLLSSFSTVFIWPPHHSFFAVVFMQHLLNAFSLSHFIHVSSE